MGAQPPYAQPPAGAPPAHVPGVVPPPPVKQKTGSAWKVAIIVGIVAILLIAVAVAALALFVFNTVKAPVDVTNNYIEAVNDGNVREAWDLLHPDSPIKEAFDLRSFEAEIIADSMKLRTWDANEVEVNNGRAEVRVDMEPSDGNEFEVVFDVRKDGGDWKIYDYSSV